jgi:hypothetical protein
LRPLIFADRSGLFEFIDAFPSITALFCQYYVNECVNIGTGMPDRRCPLEVIGFEGNFPMLRSFNRPLAATIASVGAIMAFTLVGGMAMFLSGVLQVNAEPQIVAPQVKVAVHQHHAKGDRLPVLVKGTACSPLGWPHYEQNCQFDQRRSADAARVVRVIALR